jgi:hypothetical protein
MTDTTTLLDTILAQARDLSPLDKIRLIERLMPQLEQDFTQTGPTTTRSLLGIAEDLGPAPSTEEIDEARREAWGSFASEEDY